MANIETVMARSDISLPPCTPTWNWYGPYPGRRPGAKPNGGPWLPLRGGTMKGPIYLDEGPPPAGDPTEPTMAATKHYVDVMVASGGTFVDAPADGMLYARIDNAWAPVSVDGGLY